MVVHKINHSFKTLVNAKNSGDVLFDDGYKRERMRWWSQRVDAREREATWASSLLGFS